MSKMNTDPLAGLEVQEIIQKLIDNGFGNYVECLLSNEDIVYTKKARLNKSSLCREMGIKTKQLEDALQGMKECLKKEFDLE